MVSTLPFMDFYDILCARILLNYMAMPRTVEILTSAAVLGKASNIVKNVVFNYSVFRVLSRFKMILRNDHNSTNYTV